jgi:predicted HAD superfamily phosphohydrolase YqeG
MISHTASLVVYVDVDDTLVRSVGSKRIPITRVVEHVRKLKASGATLYCWSSAGADYARQSAEELGIENCFLAFLSKPNVMIDDQSVADWRLCLEVHPLTIKDQDASQYWEQVKAK